MKVDKADPAAHLPLRSHVFEILLVLLEEERHGYAIVSELKRRSKTSALQPANLYRTLRTMLASGLIEEVASRPDPQLDDERRRYFRATPLGHEVARMEARRLEVLVERARHRRLLGESGGMR